VKLRHEALPYGDDEAFLDGTVPFLRDGLAAGDTVLAVSGERNLERLHGRLGPDADQVEFHRSGDWYRHPARTLAGCLRKADALAERGRRLRMVGEPVWDGRSALEVAEWQRVEAVVNVAFAGTGASILCPYDLRALPTSVLDAARRTHPVAARRPNPGYMDPWAFAETVDRMPLPPVPAEAAALRIDAADPYWLRQFVREYGKAIALEGWELQCLLMSVTEVAMNALRHGQPPVELRLWIDRPDAVVCEISNAGHWRPAPGAGLVPPAGTAPSRFGLWAVRLLCTIVQVRTGRGGTTVRLRLAVS
jgi:hypothetical protein